jgi:hypothetical protein
VPAPPSEPAPAEQRPSGGGASERDRERPRRASGESGRRPSEIVDPFKQ